jgi:gliding motility-associated-like protein
VDETAPTINAGSDILLDCNTTSGTFTASGSGTISWSTPSGTVTSASVNVTDASITGIYTANIIGANGCVNSDDANLSIDQVLPNADAGSDQISNCATPSVTLDGTNSSGTGITYSWSGPNVTGGGSTNTATADTPGQYTLVVTGSNGCVDSDDVTVNPDNNYPLANAGSDQILDCNNLTVILDGSGSDSGANFNYQWTSSTGNIIGTTTDDSAEVDLDATYTLTVTNTSNGCSSSDNADVVFDTITPVGIENNGTYILTCSTTSITLDASGSSGTGNSYQWTTTNGNIVSGDNSPSPVIDLDGTYSLSITSANGCSSISNTTVNVSIDTVSPNIDIALPDTLTCNNPVITLDASNSASGVTFSWTTANGNIISGQSTSNITIDAEGDYDLTITATNGCSSNSSQEVVHSTLPDAIPVANPMTGTIPLDVNFTENCIGSGLTYYWELGLGDTATTQNTNYTYSSEGSYEVILTIEDENGCVDSDTLTIIAFEDAELIIPNIFTPNEDGNNDIFKISASGINTLNATILIRWGQIVYTWETTEGGWDGRSISGSPSSEGTYYYVIEAEFLDGTTEEYTGPFSLAR